MDLSWKELLSLWVPWPQVILSLAVLGLVYGLGWYRLRQRGARRLASGWRLAAFVGGLAALAVAMLSAIEVLTDLLFTIHMVQHLLIMMVGAPLLILANPYPFFLWGLPASARRAAGWLMAPESGFRQVVIRLTSPWLIWGLYVGSIWVWHVPTAYDAALGSEFLHTIQHMMYLTTALLFWWHVTGVSGGLVGRLSYGFRIGFVLAAVVPNEILGIAITFAKQPIYSHYTTVPRLWGLSVMDDQMLAGALMWVPGGMMYILAALILLARYLAQEEKRAMQATQGLG
jgi:putative membrane protein